MKRSLLLTTITCLLAATIAVAQNNPSSKSFTTPGTYPFTVPKGVTELTVSLKGAGGWGGGSNGSTQGSGGSGGLVSGTLPVKENEELVIVVGAGGTPGKSAGITAIMRIKEYIVIAAGGGNGSSHGGRGGNAGNMGAAGATGTGTFSSGNGGSGATATAGGAGGNAGASGTRGTNGTALKGGINNAKTAGEGWGGAGWMGGGASATYSSPMLAGDPFASGGGGGGSNYTKGLTGNIINNAKGSIGGNGSNMGMPGSVEISWK